MTASISVTLVNQLSEVERLSRLVEAFGEAEGLGPEAGRADGPGPSDFKRLRDQMGALVASLKAGGTRILWPTSRRALLTVEEQALNDPSLSDLVDGTFRVIGKVIRVVPDSSASISLFRKTAMSRVPPGDAAGLDRQFRGATAATRILDANHGGRRPWSCVPGVAGRDLFLSVGRAKRTRGAPLTAPERTKR